MLSMKVKWIPCKASRMRCKDEALVDQEWGSGNSLPQWGEFLSPILFRIAGYGDDTKQTDFELHLLF